jgi:2-hydroxychromene-2-carboxylate isomerase
MALEALQRAVPEAHEQMEFVPFWEPDPRTAEAMTAHGAVLHYEAMSKAKHLYILQDTKRLAQRLGLTMAWPVDTQPWWEPAHLGWLAARRQGRARDFYDALIAARWQRGEDISRPEVVAAAGTSIGLDGAALAGAADDPELRAEGVACLVRAYEDDIFGVPYFRLGRERFWGLDRLAWFLASLRRQAAAGVPEPASDEGYDPLADLGPAARAGVGAYDTDSAGGCG